MNISNIIKISESVAPVVLFYPFVALRRVSTSNVIT